jgi:hypothetical protein
VLHHVESCLPYHDGPFSSWAVAIQQKQFRLLQTLLGADYFATHVNERVCAA